MSTISLASNAITYNGNVFHTTEVVPVYATLVEEFLNSPGGWTQDPHYKITIEFTAPTPPLWFWLRDITNQPTWTDDAAGAQQAVDDIREILPPGGGTGGAGVGFPYVFTDVTTSTDPGSGGIGFNNATAGSITKFRLSLTDLNGTDQTLQVWMEQFGSIYMIYGGGSITLTLQGSIVPDTGWVSIDAIYQAGALPADGQRVFLIPNTYQ